ncbi:hypothetical protein F5Y11DRAFT_366802 [Daldinia sp. FL1419]|nr:hypothetical protein F5Y11DRAFT_366802 [Daldinia sp. FL1419]
MSQAADIREPGARGREGIPFVQLDLFSVPDARRAHVPNRTHGIIKDKPGPSSSKHRHDEKLLPQHPHHPPLDSAGRTPPGSQAVRDELGNITKRPNFPVSSPHNMSSDIQAVNDGGAALSPSPPSSIALDDQDHRPTLWARICLSFRNGYNFVLGIFAFCRPGPDTDVTQIVLYILIGLATLNVIASIKVHKSLPDTHTEDEKVDSLIWLWGSIVGLILILIFNQHRAAGIEEWGPSRGLYRNPSWVELGDRDRRRRRNRSQQSRRPARPQPARTAIHRGEGSVYRRSSSSAEQETGRHRHNANPQRNHPSHQSVPHSLSQQSPEAANSKDVQQPTPQGK